MSEHTPGPWSARLRHGQSIRIGDTDFDGDVWQIDAPDWMYMAAVATSCGTNDEGSEANARLIAAAPELLAACREFVRKVEAGAARSTRSYQQMTAAIAKAEGR